MSWFSKSDRKSQQHDLDTKSTDRSPVLNKKTIQNDNNTRNKWNWENGWGLISAFQDYLQQRDLGDFWDGATIEISNCRHCDRHMNVDHRHVGKSIDGRRFVWNDIIPTKTNQRPDNPGATFEPEQTRLTVLRSPLYMNAFRLSVSNELDHSDDLNDHHQQSTTQGTVLLAMDIESKSMITVSGNQLQPNHLVDFHFQITKQLFSVDAKRNPGWSEGHPFLQVQWFVHPPPRIGTQQHEDHHIHTPLPKLFVMENLSLGAEWETKMAQHFVVKVVRCSRRWIDWVLDQYDALTGPCCTEAYDDHFWTPQTCSKVLENSPHHCEKLADVIERLPEEEKRALRHIHLDQIVAADVQMRNRHAQSHSTRPREDEKVDSPKDTNTNTTMSGWIIVGVLLVVILLLSLFVILYHVWNKRCKERRERKQIQLQHQQQPRSGSISVVYVDENNNDNNRSVGIRNVSNSGARQPSKKKQSLVENERLFDGDSHHVI